MGGRGVPEEFRGKIVLEGAPVTSRSLLLVGPRQLVWSESALPALGPGTVLVQTIAGAVSVGAEVPIYSGSDRTASPEYPRQMGYESYGEVVATGEGVDSVRMGDKVVAFYGHRNIAVCRQESVISAPSGIDEEMALLTILSCDAAKGVLKLNPDRADRVVVTGLGTMGLLTVHFLRTYMGVQEIHAVEPDEERARIGAQLGVTHCFRDRPPASHAYDAGFECSGRNAAFGVLQAAMKKGGRLCVLSDGNYDPFVLHPSFFAHELKIVGSSDGWNYRRHAEWFFGEAESAPALRMLFQLRIRPHELIPCFEELRTGHLHPLKILVTYGGDRE